MAAVQVFQALAGYGVVVEVVVGGWVGGGRKGEVEGERGGGELLQVALVHLDGLGFY